MLKIFFPFLLFLSVSALSQTIEGISKPYSFHISPEPDYCEKPKAPANLTLENVKFEDANNNGIIEADEKSTLSFDISNSGKGHACQVKMSLSETGLTKSGIQLPPTEVLQELAPNERKKYSLVVQGNMKQTSVQIALQLSALEKNGFDADPVKINVTVQSFLEPKLEVVDARFYAGWCFHYPACCHSKSGERRSRKYKSENKTAGDQCVFVIR